MPEDALISRRPFLGGVVSVVSMSGGCLSFGRTSEGGEVVVRNESGGDRTVDVTTSKIDEEDRQPGSDPDDLTPPASHLLQRSETFLVPDGETRSSTGLIPGPGTYHVYARDDRGEETAVEYGFPPAGRDGENPGGGYVWIDVGDADRGSRIDVSVAGSD